MNNEKSVVIDNPSGEIAKALAETIIEMKGEDVHILDLRGLTDIADWFVIASAKSKRHLKSMAEDLVGELKSAKIGRFRVEGLTSDSWVIIDLFDVVVHIFMPERREYFALEDYWADAPVEVLIDENPSADTDDE